MATLSNSQVARLEHASELIDLAIMYLNHKIIIGDYDLTGNSGFKAVLNGIAQDISKASGVPFNSELPKEDTQEDLKARFNYWSK